MTSKKEFLPNETQKEFILDIKANGSLAIVIEKKLDSICGDNFDLYRGSKTPEHKQISNRVEYLIS